MLEIMFYNHSNLVTPIILLNKLNIKTDTFTLCMKSTLVWMIHEAIVPTALNLYSFTMQ